MKEWPGAFGLFKVSRNGVRKNIGPLLILIVGIYAVSIALSIILNLMFGKVASQIINQLLSFVISIFFAIAFVRITLASARQKRLELNDSVKISGELFWKMALLELLTLATVVGGFILLIVPGVIFACRLSMAQYYLVDKNLDVMDAYKASWRATKGNIGKVLGIFGVAVLMALPTLTIIGIIATAYLLFMYSAANALLYVYLSKRA